MTLMFFYLRKRNRIQLVFTTSNTSKMDRKLGDSIGS